MAPPVGYNSVHPSTPAFVGITGAVLCSGGFWWNTIVQIGNNTEFWYRAVSIHKPFAPHADGNEDYGSQQQQKNGGLTPEAAS